MSAGERRREFALVSKHCKVRAGYGRAKIAAAKRKVRHRV